MNAILKRLLGNVFGLLLVVWLFILVIGNYDSAIALLEGKSIVYNSRCIEMAGSIDVGGTECVEYDEGQMLTIKENFIKSLWVSLLITGGVGLIILIGHSISRVKHKL